MLDLCNVKRKNSQGNERLILFYFVIVNSHFVAFVDVIYVK